MKKKSKIKGGRNQFTILRDPAYWRMRADILAIIDFLGTAYYEAISNQVMHGVKLPTKLEVEKMKKDWQKRFNTLSAFHHGQLLTALENHSPELAAALDDRELGDVDMH